MSIYWRARFGASIMQKSIAVLILYTTDMGSTAILVKLLGPVLNIAAMGSQILGCPPIINLKYS